MGGYVGRTQRAAYTRGTSDIPIGGIILWSGRANAVPAGWFLCDGSNGTPNLIGRFVMGADANTEGDVGGVSSVTLATTNLPGHIHSVPARTATTGNPSANHYHTATTGYVSAGHTHSGTSGTVSANHTHSGTTGTVSNWHAHSGTVAVDDRDHVHADLANRQLTYIAAPSTAVDFMRQDTGNHNTYGRSTGHHHTYTTPYPDTNHTHIFTCLLYTSDAADDAMNV